MEPNIITVLDDVIDVLGHNDFWIQAKQLESIRQELESKLAEIPNHKVVVGLLRHDLEQAKSQHTNLVKAIQDIIEIQSKNIDNGIYKDSDRDWWNMFIGKLQNLLKSTKRKQD